MASFVFRLLGSIVLGTEVLLLSMSKETEKERKEGPGETKRRLVGTSWEI